jgi:hypothetical protein
MKNLSEEIKKQLMGLGADMVGIGDLSMIPSEVRKNMPFGISIAIAYSHRIYRE